MVVLVRLLAPGLKDSDRMYVAELCCSSNSGGVSGFGVPMPRIWKDQGQGSVGSVINVG